jgi:hypothetical protein
MKSIEQIQSKLEQTKARLEPVVVQADKFREALASGDNEKADSLAMRNGAFASILEQALISTVDTLEWVLDE